MQSHSTSLIHRLTSAKFKAASRGIRNAVVAVALLIVTAHVSSAAVNVTATNDDGVPAATKKNPGDNVTYTIQINSTGTTDATGVTLTDPTAANTSEVAGSLNVTPVALDDTYPQTVFANMTVNTAASGFTVMTNDYPGILAGNPVALSALTITSFDGASLNGGIVTMTTSGANVGRFTYAAPPGFTGTDTFTYTISNGVAGTPTGSAVGKVSITVSGPVIWFVDSTAPAGGNGTWTGTNAKAFQTVAQAAAVDAANHRIFVLNNSGSSINYANGVALNSGEWLIGQGATNSPTNTFDAIMGISPGTDTPARPSIGGVRPTLQGTVTLETNARVQGLNLSTSTTTGLNDPAGAITGVSVSEVSVTTTTGTAVSMSSADGTFSFTSISANGGLNGIVLNTVCTNAGSFTVSGGTIQNKTGDGVRFVSANNITLQNMNLTNNAQTNGEANPTLCGATGLNGQNVNCTADVYLGTVSGITLDNVNINGSNQNGINGLNVVDLKIQNGSIVQNCGNESGESGVFIQNLTGLNNALNNSTFSGNRDWQFAVADFTSGALGNAGNPFNVSGCTFTGKGNTTTSEDGFFALIRGTTTANINIGGGPNTPSHFKSNFSYGVFTTTADTASATLTVNGCDFGTGGSTTYNNSGIATGISGSASVNYTISNNTIIGVAVGTPGNGVGIVATTGTTTAGSIDHRHHERKYHWRCRDFRLRRIWQCRRDPIAGQWRWTDGLQGHGYREPCP